jgi:hypothetical protein
MAVSLSDFESMSEKDKQNILQELKNEIGVSGIAKAWEMSRTKVYSMLHDLNVPVDSKRGRQRKEKTSPAEKELNETVQPIRSSSSNITPIEDANRFKSSLELEEEKDETKFSFYLDTQGSGRFINETLQLLLASEKLSNSELRLNISIEQI